MNYCFQLKFVSIFVYLSHVAEAKEGNTWQKTNKKTLENLLVLTTTDGFVRHFKWVRRIKSLSKHFITFFAVTIDLLFVVHAVICSFCLIKSKENLNNLKFSHLQFFQNSTKWWFVYISLVSFVYSLDLLNSETNHR